jgi:hypothetical protein
MKLRALSDSTGFDLNVTSGAAISAIAQAAMKLNLGAGSAVANKTRTLHAITGVAGTGAYNPIADSTQGGVGFQIGVDAEAFAGATGTNLGIRGRAQLSSGRNLGLVGIASSSTGSLNIGTLGNAYGLNTGSNVGVLGVADNGSGPEVGGYFGLHQGTPAFASAALIADNGTDAHPVFLARVNGTVTFSVTVSGKMKGSCKTIATCWRRQRTRS